MKTWRKCVNECVNYMELHSLLPVDVQDQDLEYILG